jgi:hypothetical protein
MSLKLVATGPVSPASGPQLLSPNKVLISGNGLRAFWRAQTVLTYPTGVNGNQFEGYIGAVDWNGSDWSTAASLGGWSGGSETYDEGLNLLEISKNGQNVAWDFTFHSPNTFEYLGIQISGQNSGSINPFVPANLSAPASASGTQVTRFANAVSSTVYIPKIIKFSDDGTFRFIYFQSGNNLIEVTGRPSLFFPANGTYGNNLQNFQVSGNGDSIFVFIGQSIKEFTWNGASWQFVNNILNTGAGFFSNVDGTILATQTSDYSAVRVFQKTGLTWEQLGGDMPSGSPWLNSSGTLLNVGGKLYLWNGTTWQFQWDTFGAISDDGAIAVGSAGAGVIKRYKIQDVVPIYAGSTIASGIYVGSTSATAVYYGEQKLWPATL